jgi:predicted TIM-barrel fold metal-dependent hydrolase
VFMKLGGLGLPVMGFGFQHRTPQASSQELAQAWRRYFETCIEAFGPDRCMFESDFPPDKEVCSYTVIWNAFKRIAAGCSADEQAALFGGTAARAYRLKLPL